MSLLPRIMACLTLAGLAGCQVAPRAVTEDHKMPVETKEERDARMAWWREARFGMFIHWGLYAIPAGQWNDQTQHGEWIMHTAQIPMEQYERFADQFNPVNFDADEWVRIAQDAGMRYIVITTKHHDGFGLFDSAHSDYDIMATPFQRDIMKELADACRRAGLRTGWYHSIMDWHHPDYLPRRSWETRSAEGADYARYFEHLKNQVRELLTHYGPIGVMWFDGEWEGTWTHEHGQELAAVCRGIQPQVIVNNRVDKGRSGMAGMTTDERFAGDFGTPEQEIPATGFPGVDWETCMTMNDNWGYNRHDDNWKSSADLIRKLVDIASKGGNFLLNVGPTARGDFPPASVERLRDIGRWMKVNRSAIHGTGPSPFQTLPWGRCTQAPIAGGTRLYLHVFDWPTDGQLVVPGIFNHPRRVWLLADAAEHSLPATRREDALLIQLDGPAPDPVDSVVVLDIIGRPDINNPPTISAEADIFVDALNVQVFSGRENVELHYTTNGNDPTVDSPAVSGPVRLTETTTIRARVFRGGRPVSGVSQATFTKVPPRPAVVVDRLTNGVDYEYFEGDWDRLPDFDQLRPVKTGTLANFTFAPRNRAEHFGFRYHGYLAVSTDGVYTFSTFSDDGSRLFIGDQLVVDNDGLHGMHEATGQIALAAGLHPITVTFFEKTGSDDLEVRYAGPGLERQLIPDAALSRGRP